MIAAYLPRTAEVARWLGVYGSTLNDVPSFRNQIAVVRAEVGKNQALPASWRRQGLDFSAEALEEGLRQAGLLIERLERRIMALGEQPDPAVARLCAHVAQMVEAYGDDILEAGL